jgi:hypothetical protein
MIDKKMFIATLYFETSDTSIRPNSKIQIVGAFTKKPWVDMLQCKYDPYFKCFKADKIKIKIG